MDSCGDFGVQVASIPEYQATLARVTNTSGAFDRARIASLIDDVVRDVRSRGPNARGVLIAKRYQFDWRTSDVELWRPLKEAGVLVQWKCVFMQS
jgi:hypothetical protein